MKRTNRFLSIILAVIMVVGMLPITSLTAFAETQDFGDFTVTGDDLTGVSFSYGVLSINTNKPLTISNKSGVSETAHCINIPTSAGSANITLKGVNIGSSSMAINAFSSVTLTLDGNNTLSGLSGFPALYGYGGITITGNGSLTATSSNYYAIEALGTMKISGNAKVTANSLYESGISCGNLTINENAVVTANGGNIGIKSTSGIAISDNAQVSATGNSYAGISITGVDLAILGNARVAAKGGKFGIHSSRNITIKENAVVTADGTDCAMYINNGPSYKITIENTPFVILNGGIGGSGTTAITGGIVFENTAGALHSTPFELKNNAEIPAGYTLTIEEGQTLTIDSSATLTNNGTIIVKGTLTKNGTIDGTESVIYKPAITTASLSDGKVGEAYTQTLAATGGNITWSPKEGSTLPDGLTLNKTTGEISGTPTAAGTVTFILVAENAAGKAEKELSITIAKATATDVETPNATPITYGQTLAKSALPDGWEWEDPTIVPTVTNGGYIATYAIADDTNYDWSGVSGYNSTLKRVERIVSVNVNKAVPSYTVPTGLAATYGDTLSDVTLPTGFTWQDAGTTSVGNAGTNQFKVTFTPPNADNYETVTDISVNITVEKATPTVDTKPTASRVIINNALSTSTLSGGVASVPGTFAWKDGTEVLGATGTVQKTVIFTPDDTANYNSVEYEVDVTVEYATYVINTGAKQEVTKGNDAVFVSDADFSKFLKVQVDGKDIDAKYYTAESGSTKITLKKEFIETLSIGEHTLSVVSADGTAATTFTVKAAPVPETDSPQTGDNSNMALWIALLFVSGMGIVGTTVYGRKKRTN